MKFNDDEQIPYRSAVPTGIIPKEEASVDEAHFDTLKIVQRELRDGIRQLDQWHAFDLKKENTSLSVEQQILAHRQAFDILAPILAHVDGVIERIDAKYREN